MLLYARSTARIRHGYTRARCVQTQPPAAFRLRTTRVVYGIPFWRTTSAFCGTCDVCGGQAEWPLEANTERRSRRPQGVLGHQRGE